MFFVFCYWNGLEKARVTTLQIRQNAWSLMNKCINVALPWTYCLQHSFFICIKWRIPMYSWLNKVCHILVSYNMNPCWCSKDHPDKIDILTSFWELFECEWVWFVLEINCDQTFHNYWISHKIVFKISSNKLTKRCWCL